MREVQQPGIPLAIQVHFSIQVQRFQVSAQDAIEVLLQDVWGKKIPKHFAGE